MPYGTRSGEVVTRYALLSARHLARHGIKLLVVACNTVSAHSLHALAEALPIPVVGVIEPGAQAAAARSKGGTIAVLGTPATIASGAYQAALRRLAPLSAVVARACPLFVPMAEEGWIEGEVPRLVAERYLGDLRRGGVDTAVLGCTHYPLLWEAIAQVLGQGIALVDPPNRLEGLEMITEGTVIFTAHGVSPQVRARAAENAGSMASRDAADSADWIADRYRSTATRSDGDNCANSSTRMRCLIPITGQFY